MSKIFSKIFNALKYILLVVAFALVFLGIILMYDRLQKSVIEAVPVLLPFALVLIIFIVSLFVGRKEVSENLLFNFGCVLIFAVIIIIGLRAKFDTNMIIYHRYGISYNSAYMADNLSMIESMLYLIFASNLLIMFGSKKKKKNSVSTTENVSTDPTVTEPIDDIIPLNDETTTKEEPKIDEDIQINDVDSLEPINEKEEVVSNNGTSGLVLEEQKDVNKTELQKEVSAEVGVVNDTEEEEEIL